MPNLSIRASPDYIKWLDDLADESGLSNRTEFIKYVLSNYATDAIEELDSERLKKYQEVVEQQAQDAIDKKIAKVQQKNATYHTFMAHVVQDMNDKDADREEILNVLESNKPIAERRGKLEELKKLIKAVEADSWDMVQRWASRYESN